MSKLGTLDVNAFKVGSADCKVYLGSVLVYEPSAPTPPLPDNYKVYFKYDGDNTYSAECSSSGEIVAISDVRSPQYPYSSMTDAYIGDCVETLSGNAFSECISLSSVTIPSGVTSIGINSAAGGCFSKCYSLTGVSIPNSVTNIGQYIFGSCSGLTSVNLSSGITSIPNYSFQDCSSLSSVAIPSGVTSIGNNAFIGCRALGNVTLPDGLTSIGQYAFQACSSPSFSSITIPSGVTVLESGVLRNCSGLTEVTIPSGVTDIKLGAFRYDPALETVTIYAATPPTLGSNVFANGNDTFIIRVPSESVTVYQSASGWSTYASRIEAIPNS